MPAQLPRWNIGVGRVLLLVLVGLVGFFLPQFLPLEGLWSAPLRFLISLAVLAVAFRLVSRGSGDDLGLGPAPLGRCVGWALAAGLGAQAVTMAVNAAVGGTPFPGVEATAELLQQSALLQTVADEAGEPVPVEPYAPAPVAAVVPIILSIVVLAPVVEEVVFRGLVFRGVRDLVGMRLPAAASFWIAALAQAALFAGIHPSDPMSLLVTGGLAILWAAAFARTGSLTVAMVAHSLFNATTMLIVAVGPNRPVAFPPAIVALIVVAPLITWAVAAVLRRTLGTGLRIAAPLPVRA